MRPALAVSVAVAMAAACATTPAAARSRAAGRLALPLYVTDMTNGIRGWAELNGMRLTQAELGGWGAYQNARDLPPFLLRAGTNTLVVHYTVDEDSAQYYPDGLAFSVAIAGLGPESDRTWEPRPLVDVLAQATPPLTGCAESRVADVESTWCTATLTFTLPATTRLPAWRWTTDAPIEDTARTRTELIAAYRALHAELAAVKQAPGKAGRLRTRLTKQLADQARSEKLAGHARIADLEDLIVLAKHPEAFLDELFDPATATVELLAGGTLARLRHDNLPLIEFAGGAHDAPAGTRGPFDVWFDVWFRKDHGRWVPAALWRTSIMPTL